MVSHSLVAAHRRQRSRFTGADWGDGNMPPLEVAAAILESPEEVLLGVEMAQQVPGKKQGGLGGGGWMSGCLEG